MIIVLTHTATEADIKAVVDRVQEIGLKTELSRSEARTPVGAIGGHAYAHKEALPHPNARPEPSPNPRTAPPARARVRARSSGSGGAARGALSSSGFRRGESRGIRAGNAGA